MKLNKIIECLEKWASPSLQEEYDNSGLIIGNNQNEIKVGYFEKDFKKGIIVSKNNKINNFNNKKGI